MGIAATAALEIFAADRAGDMVRTPYLMIEMVLEIVEVQVALLAIVVAVEFVLLEKLKSLEPKGAGLPWARIRFPHLQRCLCLLCPLSSITSSKLYRLLCECRLVHHTGFALGYLRYWNNPKLSSL